MHMNKEHAYADLVSRVKKSYPTVKDLENEEGLCFYSNSGQSEFQ